VWEAFLTPASGSSTTTLPAAPELSARTVPLCGLSDEEVQARLVDVGNGRPVVFLHGLVGLNDHWEDVARRIAHRMRCVMLEIPLLQLNGADCSVDGVEALTVAFLERHLGGIRPAPILVGNSFGGHVALRIAIDRPDLVGGLVLAGASGLIERTMVSDVQIRPSREWLSRKIGELFYNPAKNMREADLDRAHRELSDRRGARAMVKLSRSARRNHLGARIHEIAAPTLLIWGKNDVVTPPEAADQFMANLRDARIVWFDECGHAPMMERPADFAEAMLAFADELNRRTAAR
jgi:2-hydroxy-6-oxonona-2,4-dienedioate hydrolase